MTTTDEDLVQSQEGDSDLVKRLRAEIAARNEQLTEQSTKIQEQDTRLADLEAKEQQATKAQLFDSLKIDVEAGPGKLLYDSYSGELEAEAVRSHAEAYGLLPEGESPGSESEEAEAHKVINRAAAGAATAPVNAETPQEVMREKAKEVYSQTGSRDNAMAAAFEAGLQKAAEQRKSA